MIQKSNFHVITGCSGSGKSTLVEALRGRGYLCVDEPGREIVREQLRIGRDALPWKDQRKFREALFERYVGAFNEMLQKDQPVFFDRALPEMIGFARTLGEPLPDDHRVACEVYRYARGVFVTPPWPEIFENDVERRHSFQDALAMYPLNLASYSECGYEIIEVPRAPVADRVEFILRLVNGVE
jgi:predicted ATPase